MSELTPPDDHLPAPPDAPSSVFQRLPTLTSGGANVGSIAIEQERAIAEVQGQIIVAQKFRRSMAQARAEFMDSCKDPAFAKAAFYTVPNRGTGPSIRFAEEVARCYGNFQYGHRELSRTETKGDAIGKSEVEVFAWDVEKNNRSIRQITVLHLRDKQGGPTKLTDQTDIDNRVANVASKQMRGRILALMPKHIVQAGIDACKLTIAGNNDKPISERINGMAEAFKRFGVSIPHIQAYLGHALDTTTIDELADMMGIFTAIKEGAKASDYFKIEDAAKAGNVAAGAAIAAAAKTGNATPPPPPAVTSAPAATPAPAPAVTSAPAATPAPTPRPTRAPAARPAATPAPTAAPPAAEQQQEEEDPFRDIPMDDEQGGAPAPPPPAASGKDGDVF